MPALAALLILTAWIMSEPARWRERLKLRRVTDFAVPDDDPDCRQQPHRRHAVGTGLGLALRLVGRDVEPPNGNPPTGRSFSWHDRTLANLDSIQ